MGKVPALGVFHILQEAAGGAEGEFECLAAEALQIVGLELGVERAPCALCVELPGGLAACAAARGNLGVIDGLVIERFRRVQPL